MTSPLQSQVPWMLSRACGFGAFVAFTAVVVLGLLAASGLLRRLGSKSTPDVTAFHRVLALVAWPLIVAHALLLLADPWLHATVAQLAWPFSLHVNARVFTGLGIFAAAALAATAATPWLQRRIRRVPWRAVHRTGSLVAYPLLAAHVIGAGTDVRHGVVHFVIVQVLVVIGVVVAVRIVAPRLPERRVAASS